MGSRPSVPTPQQKKRGRIAPAVAEIRDRKNEPEDEHLRVSFWEYRTDLCDISSLMPASARKGLTTLKTVGKITAPELSANNIRTDPVNPTGNYKVLFSKLEEDVSLLHTNLGEKARMFYYIVGNEFRVIAILVRHL